MQTNRPLRVVSETVSQLNVRLADAPSQRLAPLIFIGLPYLTNTKHARINYDSDKCQIQVECLMTLGLMIVRFVSDGLRVVECSTISMFMFTEDLRGKRQT